jgi:hypothetical protein
MSGIMGVLWGTNFKFEGRFGKIPEIHKESHVEKILRQFCDFL